MTGVSKLIVVAGAAALLVGLPATDTQAARVTAHVGVHVGPSYGYVGGYRHYYPHGPHCHCGCLGPPVVVPPVYGYPAIVLPVPRVRPPVIYRRYRYYRYPSAVIHYHGRHFGLSIGF
ncbi:MAG TPA: hypothetical protein EYH34_18665 [Planctomycetes bacterium]|nr:hypothetical protein [Planctomycetota bacterium]